MSDDTPDPYYYVTFGERTARRRWEDARRYGFVSAGGGWWYSRTLFRLTPGDRVFVLIPKVGYVGVGDVVAPPVRVDDFLVEVDGAPRPILDADLAADRMHVGRHDHEQSEYLVRVDWLETLDREDAVWLPGMFANQNTVCALRHEFTRDVLLQHFDLAGDRSRA